MALTTILYPVRDLAGATKVFSAFLGTPPTTDTPYYVGFSVDGQEIGLVGGGKLIATVADPDGNVIGVIQPA